MTTYHRIIEDGIGWPEPLLDNRDAIEHEIADALGIPVLCVSIDGWPKNVGSDGALEVEFRIRTEVVQLSEADLAELDRVINAD